MKKFKALGIFRRYGVQISDSRAMAWFTARTWSAVLATTLHCAPVLAGPEAFDLKPLRDASLAIERQRIADLEARGVLLDAKTKEEVSRFLNEMHFPNPTKQAIVYPSEEPLIRLRALVESETLFDGNLKDAFGIQMGSESVKTHPILGRFRIRFPELFDDGSGSVLPSTQRLIRSAENRLEVNAGPGLAKGYSPDLVPVLGKPPKRMALSEQFEFNTAASTLQYPMGSPGFDGGAHILSNLSGDKGTLVFVLPDQTTDKTLENWPREYWIKYTSSGWGDITSRDDRIWQRPRGQLRSYVQHFSTRAGWRLTIGQPGKFLYFSTLLVNPSDWILDPNFDTRSTPMQFLFSGEAPTTGTTKDDSFRRYVIAHVYQTQTQLTYNGKKGLWRLFYQPIYDPTQEISANAQIPRMRGQWVVHYRPFVDGATLGLAAQGVSTSQSKTMDQVVAIINSASKPLSIQADYRARGFDSRLEEPASNSPPRLLYQLIHPALKTYDSDDTPSSALLIEPSCGWYPVKSRQIKWKKTVHSVCKGHKARVTISLIFKDLNPGNCLKASHLKQMLSTRHKLLIVNDFYRNKSFSFPLVWAPTYRGGSGNWGLPASLVAAGKAPPVFQNDLDMRQWSLASATEKFDVISKVSAQNRLLLGLWVKDDCVELLQFMKSI